MSKNRKHLLRSSFIMLLVAVIALSSATYAWFSSGKTTTVTALEFEATAESGVQISVDASTWKSTVSADDIAAEIKTGGVQAGRCVSYADLSPASSNGGVTNGALDIYTISVSDTTATSSAATQATQGTSTTKGGSGGYYCFDLYFLNTGSKNMTISLDSLGTDSKVSGKSGDDSGIQNAVRVAFVDQGYASTATDAIAKAGGTSSVIWEPNDTTHTAFATNSRGATAATTAAYYGISEAGTGKWDGNAVTDTVVGSSATTVSKGTTAFSVATLEPGISKITVYIWIEGQDVDCNNAESGGTVVTKLSFTAAEVTT